MGIVEEVASAGVMEVVAVEVAVTEGAALVVVEMGAVALASAT